MNDVKVEIKVEDGNMEHVETLSLQDKVVVVRFKIRPDVYTELEEIHHMQYFCFFATAFAASMSRFGTPLSRWKSRHPGETLR